MKGICYIIGAGQIEDLKLKPSNHDFIIAADAGFLHLAGLSVVADLVVGDFDSLGVRPIHPNVVEHPREKDQTDMMLAIEEGLRRDYKKFVILGGLGGRLDHTYANIQTLSYLAQNNACGYLLGGGTAITVIRNSSMTFDSEKKGIISIFCSGERAQGVSLKGLKYPLSDANLEATYPIGVSNEFKGIQSEIFVSNGSLIIMWEEQSADFIDNLTETCYSSQHN